jgi:ADP-ribose pyrophosphatase
MKKLENWKTVSRTSICKYGRFLSIEQHAVEISKDKIIPDWMWVETPHFINVLARTNTGKWLIFRQTKYAVGVLLGGITLATVGGYLEQNEDPLTAAKRELLEETGYESNHWVHLQTAVADANRGSGIGHLFLALDAVKSAQFAESDDLEECELLEFTTEELENALFNQQFKVFSWASTVSMSLLYCMKMEK